MIQPRFFLVDDNPIDIMVNKKLLSNTFGNCPVNAFNNSTDALKYFAENVHNTEELPTTLLLDIIMPRVDGFEFIEKLEVIFSGKIPFKIFLLSSTLDEADFEKARESKWVRMILGKPLDTEALRDLI